MTKNRAHGDPYSVLGAAILAHLVEWGVLPAERPTDGSAKTGLDYWREWSSGDCLIDPANPRLPGFNEYRSIKIWLGAKLERHPRVILAAVAAALVGISLSRGKVSSLIGYFCSADMAILRQMTGREQRNPRRQGDATIADLLALFDRVDRARIEQLLAEPRLTTLKLKTSWIVRALALSPGWREMAATGLLQCVIDGLKSDTTSRYLTVTEAVAEAVGGRLRIDSADIEPRLSVTAPGWGTSTLAERTRLFLNLAAGCRAWVKDKLGDDTKLASLLPTVSNEATTRRDIRRTLKDSTCDREVVRVQKIVDRLEIDEAAVAAIKNREDQVARLQTRFDQVALEMARDGVSDRLFPIEEQVVRENGSLGEGMQIVSYRALTRTAAGALAIQLNPGRANYQHKASFRGDDIVLVYVGVRAKQSNGQAVEPFFVGLFRRGVIDFPKGLSDFDRPIAEAIIRQNGYKPPLKLIAGVLTTPLSIKALANVFRTNDAANGVVVLPIEEFAHAMLMARLILDLGRETGKRVSELLQLRTGAGLGYILSEGQKLPFFRSRPKGKRSQHRAFFSTDAAELIWRAIGVAHRRFAPEVFDRKGRPDVMVRNFRGTGREEGCDPGPFVFQHAGDGLAVDEINAMVRTLLIGIVKLTMHDERYLFATRYSRDHGDDYGLKRKLSHSPNSSSTRIYNLWPAIVALNHVRQSALAHEPVKRWDQTWNESSPSVKKRDECESRPLASLPIARGSTADGRPLPPAVPPNSERHQRPGSLPNLPSFKASGGGWKALPVRRRTPARHGPKPCATGRTNALT